MIGNESKKIKLGNFCGCWDKHGLESFVLATKDNKGISKTKAIFDNKKYFEVKVTALEKKPIQDAINRQDWNKAGKLVKKLKKLIWVKLD